MFNIKDEAALLVFIKDSLTPTQSSKDRGEVFTPMGLIEEMLDKLPQEVWQDPSLTWLDPAAGIGNFPLAVYMRLMKGLKECIPDDEKRTKYILEDMLYMVEIYEPNISVINDIFCHTEYKLNLYEGSFFDYEPNMKFNIIIGNPPFQKVETGETKKEIRISKYNSNYWSIFVKNCFNSLLKDKGYLLFITPFSWMSSGSQLCDIYYKHQLLYINIAECGRWFGGVGSTFSYYLIKKEANNGGETEVVCKYRSNKVIYKSKICIPSDTTFLPTLLSKDALGIVNKFFKHNFDSITFKKNCWANDFYNPKNKHLFGGVGEYEYPVLMSTTKGLGSSKEKDPITDKKKIIMSFSGNNYPQYDDGLLGTTSIYMVALCDNKHYVEVLNSKLYRFIFKVCKWCGFCNNLTYKNIPYIDYFKNDEDIYNKFNLTEEERRLIDYIT
jgi:hypothetical protein